MKSKYVFLFISIIICIISTIYNLYPNKLKKIKFEKISTAISKFVNKYYKYFVIVIFIILIFTSMYQLGIVPAGFHVDEAGMAYDALSISKYGVDRYLNKFPIYLINFGGGQSAMYAYLAAVLIKIFGYKISVIRLPAILLRIAMSITAFLMVKEIETKKKSLLMLFLLAIFPYFIMQSRWGLDCNLLVGFLTIAMSLFIIAHKKNNNILLVISGIFFGLTLYTYALSYIIVPLILLVSIIYLIYLKKIKLKQIIIFGIPIFLLAIPLMLMILINNGIISEISGIITIPKLPDYRGAEISINNIFKNVYIFKNILTFDKIKELYYNALPNFGTVYYFSIPFIIIGFIITFLKTFNSIKNKKINYNTFIIIWALSVIISQLIIKNPCINKANAIFLPLAYFCMMGISYISRKNTVFEYIIIIIYIINFIIFFNYYFNVYNQKYTNQNIFPDNYVNAIKYVKDLNQKNNYIEEGPELEEYIYPLLFNETNPYEFQKTAKFNKKRECKYFESNKNKYYFGIDNIDNDGVYLIKYNQEQVNDLKAKEYEYVLIENYFIFYKNPT